MKTKEQILDECLYGVHKEMIEKHWAFKKKVLKAMDLYLSEKLKKV